ncbi:MAG TPA: hypothetical protein VMA54_15645 [Steroidobacteraceae bacterium]|nr:hypothetical protein [Steroidobacteraceae bacterium]
MNKTVIAILGSLLLGVAAAAMADDAATAVRGGVHRYVVERTFPAHALDHLDAALKAKVNANNAKFRFACAGISRGFSLGPSVRQCDGLCAR